MRKLSVLILFLFAFTFPNAQLKLIAESPEFEKPTSTAYQLVPFKNGNTLLFQILKRGEINITIYDVKHKQKLSKRFKPNNKIFEGGSINGIFEVNNDLIVMMRHLNEEKIPELYRVIIDGKTGDLKEDKKIAELMRLDRSQGYASGFGNVPQPMFFVKTNPHTEYYAVAIFNSFEPNRNKRIEIIFYDSEHKEISRSYFASPDNKYKYLEYKDMAIVENKKVSVLAFAYNTAASGEKEKELLLANLDKGAMAMTYIKSEFFKNIAVEAAFIKYNQVSQKIILLANKLANKSDLKLRITLGDIREIEYDALLVYIDPFAEKVEKVLNPYPAEANKKSIELFGKKSAYKGFPKDLCLNNDGSFSIVYEELTRIETQNLLYYEAGDIAILLFDKIGEEIKSYLIPKNNERDGDYPFRASAYISGPSKSYFLFNDIEENDEKIMEGKKVKTIRGVKECDAFYFDLSGTNVLTRRQFLFGKSENKKDHYLGLFNISVYNRATDEYMTLKQGKGGKDKNATIVWLKPE